MKYLLILLMLVVALGCTEQARSRQFGGTASVDLPCGSKLVMASWKGESDLWLLLREMHEAEDPQEYVYQESSSWGVMEGKIVIKECKVE